MINRLIFPIVIRWRKFLRKYTRPMSVDEAAEKKELLSKLYLFSAFGALIFMTFLVYKNDLDFPYDPALPKDEAMGKIIKGNNFRLIKFQGFQKVGDVVYTQDDEGNYKKEEK